MLLFAVWSSSFVWARNIVLRATVDVAVQPAWRLVTLTCVMLTAHEWLWNNGSCELELTIYSKQLCTEFSGLWWFSDKR